MSVQTVQGPVHRGDLGITSPHEHILLDLSGFYSAHPVRGIDDPSAAPVVMENLGVLMRDPYALKENLLLNDPELQRNEIINFREAGGKTIADATLPGIGRDPALLQKLSRETGLNVIMGTGYYVGATHPDHLQDMMIEDIAEEMINEIEKGVGDTGIKAGFIGEIGISEHFDDRERRVLHASAIAQQQTKTAIHVHINPWTTNGIEAANILLNAGVSPRRINICHVDVENRDDYIRALLDKGVFVEFDNFGKEYYVDQTVRNSGYGCFVRDVDRVELICKLISQGYSNQILLSCDVCLKILLHKYGGWGYDHILTNIIPMLIGSGVTETQIEQMLVENPADFFDVTD